MLSTKTYITLLFLSSIYFIDITAQKVDISPPSKLSAATEKVKIVGKNADGYVAWLSGEGEIFQVYNSDMKLAFAKTFSFAKNEGYIQHIQLYNQGGVVFFLRQEPSFTLLVAQVLNNNFMNNGDAIAIDTIYERIDIANANLRFKQSIDQRFILFYTPVFSSKQIESMQTTAIDKNLNRVYKYYFPIQQQEKNMQFAKAFVDTQGNSLLIFNKNEQSYSAAWLDKSLIEPLRYSIASPKKIFGDPYFEIDNKNNNLIFGGFYDNLEGTGEPAAYGCFYQIYKPSNGIQIASNYQTFPDAFIKELTGREATITNNRLFTFSIRKIVQRNDGGLMITAESYIRDRREEQTLSLSVISPYNNFRTINTFQFNDIIAFAINPSGKIDWTSLMRKRQYSEDDNGYNSSFFAFNQKDRMRFIFPEEISYSSDIDEYVLGSDGKTDKRLIFNQGDKDVFLIPKMGKQVSANEVIIPSVKKGAFRLVRLKY